MPQKITQMVVPDKNLISGVSNHHIGWIFYDELLWVNKYLLIDLVLGKNELAKFLGRFYRVVNLKIWF